MSKIIDEQPFEVLSYDGDLEEDSVVIRYTDLSYSDIVNKGYLNMSAVLDLVNNYSALKHLSIIYSSCDFRPIGTAIRY